MEIECHNCQKKFEAHQDERGECPYCGTRYDWVWEGEIWSADEHCFAVFDSESEDVKKHFLIVRDWI